MPDVRAPTVRHEAQRQAAAVAASRQARDDQDFIDAISADPEPWSAPAWPRGDIWTVSGGKDYAGKPRPAVILRDDAFAATDSVTICAFPTDPTDAPLFRLPITPNDDNGLRAPCRPMIDTITTVPRHKIGSLIGRLDPADMKRLDEAVLVFLGLAGALPSRGLTRARAGRVS